MGVHFTLEIAGRVVNVPDPSGAVCNAAGDFDGLLPVSADLPALYRIDVYGEVEFEQSDTAVIVVEAAEPLSREQGGPERRGVLGCKHPQRAVARSHVQFFALAETDAVNSGMTSRSCPTWRRTLRMHMILRQTVGYRPAVGMRNYLVEGVSGTGKTSVCKELRGCGS